MSLRRCNGLVTIAVLICVFAVATVAAETRLTIVTARPKATMGSMVIPAAVDTSFIWLGDSLARLDKTDGTSFIFNQRNLQVFRLYHKFELYDKLDLIDTVTHAESSAGWDQFSSGLAKVGSEPETQVEPTADTSTIDGYPCRKYIFKEIKVGMVTLKKTSEVWATTKIDVDFDLYQSILHISELVDNGNLRMLPLFRQIDGVVVLRTGSFVPVAVADSTEQVPVSIDGGDRSELIKVERLPAPAGLFEVPKGYEVAPG